MYLQANELSADRQADGGAGGMDAVLIEEHEHICTVSSHVVMTEQGAISLHSDIRQTQLPHAGGELRCGNDLSLQTFGSSAAEKHGNTGGT